MGTSWFCRPCVSVSFSASSSLKFKHRLIIWKSLKKMIDDITDNIEWCIGKYNQLIKSFDWCCRRYVFRWNVISAEFLAFNHSRESIHSYSRIMSAALVNNSWTVYSRDSSCILESQQKRKAEFIKVYRTFSRINLRILENQYCPFCHISFSRVLYPFSRIAPKEDG